MTTVTYSLDEFVHDMNVLIDDKADQEKIFDVGSAQLERLINNPEAIPDEFRFPAGSSNHGSYLLHYGDNGLLITTVVWGPGDHIGPHDHRTWGMIGVMDNSIRRPLPRRLRRTRKGPPDRRKARRCQPFDPRRGRNPPDGQPRRQAHCRGPRLWHRPPGPGAQQIRPRNRSGDPFRDEEVQ